MTDPVIAIRRLLIDEWVAANTDGYSPTAPTDDPYHIHVHTGVPRDTALDPQIVVEGVDETPRGGDYDAIAADGTGLVRTPEGLIDVRCVSGTEDDVDPHPRGLASAFADEVAEILHANSDGIVDPDTGELQFKNIGPGQKRGPNLDPDEGDRWFAIQEATYDYEKRPPTR